ncbi:uncharacterized protein VNE69_01003 [Vairimorpha necatrix]|uniref:Uncharacterized protein n=1 Tax=Vairimorpha necatrix TaxID=6039 RepID=A0AAX4J7Z3_9MICR
MLLGLTKSILFVYSDSYLLFNYKEDDTCNCYISLPNKAEIDDNCKVFLSKYEKRLYEEARHSCSADIFIKKVYEEGLILEVVDKKDYEKIGRLAGIITNVKTREIFLNNENYRKCSLNKCQHTNFFFEIVFYEPKKHKITWEHSAMYDYDPKYVFGKLMLHRTRSLTISAGFYELYIENLNSSIRSDTHKLNITNDKRT